MSDTPRTMLFSSAQNPRSWEPNPDFFEGGVITCLTDGDAKKAEALFNALREQLADANLRHDNLVKMLEEEHARLAKRDQELSDLSKSYEGMDDTWADMVVKLRAELSERDAALAYQSDVLEKKIGLAIYWLKKNDSNKVLGFLEEYILLVNVNLPESAKHAAKVLEAARKLAALEMRDDPHLSNLEWTDALQELCQAVRGMKG